MAKAPKADSKSVMLAPNSMIAFDDHRIPYEEGVYASPKFDGNRLFIRAGELLTRSMLPQRNKHLAEYLRDIIAVSKEDALCFDGEIVIPDASHHGLHGKVFNSFDAEIPPGTTYHVFDALWLSEWNGEREVVPFRLRRKRYINVVFANTLKHVVAVQQTPVKDANDAKRYFEVAIDKGYEGMMLRAAESGYKQGRCGHKGAWLLKFKAEETVDGVITEVIQMRKMKEGLDRTRNAFGHLERPTVNDENYTTQDAVGAVRVRTEDGIESEVMFAAGFADMNERRQMWKDRKSLIGRWVEIKHYQVGAKDGLRSGRIIRWRDDKEGSPRPRQRTA